jgi:methylthioribose-1-phosphate isomerase
MTSGFIPTLRTGRAHPHPEPISGATYSAVELMPGDRSVVILDQRKLPVTEKYEMLNRPEQVADAISEMLVRGAPAIGIAGAYGLVLAAATTSKDTGREFSDAMQKAADALRATRPTAVNLAWALDRMMRLAAEITTVAGPERIARLAAEARGIHREDVAACKKIGELGAEKIKDGAVVLTHCNAGALATGGFGTALGLVRAARSAGKKVRVIASETRPLLQGARLTAWELEHDGIPVEVVTDNMIAALFAARAIDVAIVGADRIAKNGDVANKIGTYGVACLARLHDVPFYVAAPWSTVDLATANGAGIPIEDRSEQEVSHIGDLRVMPDNVHARNPAFDITPARLIDAIFTERGAAEPPSEATLARLAG